MVLSNGLGIKLHFMQFSPNPTFACNSPPPREILIAVDDDKHASQSNLNTGLYILTPVQSAEVQYLI
jgi:hypothetical protein